MAVVEYHKDEEKLHFHSVIEQIKKQPFKVVLNNET